MRIVALVLTCFLMRPALGLAAGTEFAVSLSASDATPSAHHVPEVGEQFYVYLWLTCGMDGGSPSSMASFEADVVSNYAVTDFEPMSGVLSAGTAQHLLLAVTCSQPPPPFLLGRWTVGNPDAAPSGSVCLQSCGAECCEFQFCWDGNAGVHGFAVGDSLSCSADNGCVAPTAVEPFSWGSAKVRYRNPSLAEPDQR